MTLVSRPTELPKTKEEFEERLIFKSFFLKSMNAFAPIFYVAFFKGRCVCVSFTTSLQTHFSPVVPSSSYSDFVPFSHRFAGRPGDYVYVFGDYRMEEVIINLFVTVFLIGLCLWMLSKCVCFPHSVLHQAASSSCASSSA